MNNQACKARPEIVSVNSNNPVFCHFSIKTSKFSGNCNNINDLYAKILSKKKCSGCFKRLKR